MWNMITSTTTTKDGSLPGGAVQRLPLGENAHSRAETFTRDLTSAEKPVTQNRLVAEKRNREPIPFNSLSPNARFSNSS